jgi:hypothetical protein
MSGDITVIRKPINLGNAPEFVEQSECSDPSSSFYSSLGLALLETIVRGRACNQFLCGLTEVLEQEFKAIEEIAKENKAENEYLVLASLFNVIKNQEYSRNQILDWIQNHYMKSNADNAVNSIITIMKFIICKILENQPQIHQEIYGRLPLKDESVKTIFNNICTAFPVHIRLIKNDSDNIHKRLNPGEFPLLVFYQNQSSFSILYHKTVLEFDQNEDLNFNLCKSPFTYRHLPNPSIIGNQLPIPNVPKNNIPVPGQGIPVPIPSPGNTFPKNTIPMPGQGIPVPISPSPVNNFAKNTIPMPGQGIPVPIPSPGNTFPKNTIPMPGQGIPVPIPSSSGNNFPKNNIPMPGQGIPVPIPSSSGNNFPKNNIPMPGQGIPVPISPSPGSNFAKNNIPMPGQGIPVPTNLAQSDISKHPVAPSEFPKPFPKIPTGQNNEIPKSEASNLYMSEFPKPSNNFYGQEGFNNRIEQSDIKNPNKPFTEKDQKIPDKILDNIDNGDKQNFNKIPVPNQLLNIPLPVPDTTSKSPLPEFPNPPNFLDLQKTGPKIHSDLPKPNPPTDFEFDSQKFPPSSSNPPSHFEFDSQKFLTNSNPLHTMPEPPNFRNDFYRQDIPSNKPDQFDVQIPNKNFTEKDQKISGKIVDNSEDKQNFNKIPVPNQIPNIPVSVPDRNPKPQIPGFPPKFNPSVPGENPIPVPNSTQKNQFIPPGPQFFNNPAEVPKIPGANENPKPPSPQIPGFPNLPQKLPSDPKEFQKNAPKVYSDLSKVNPSNQIQNIPLPVPDNSSKSQVPQIPGFPPKFNPSVPGENPIPVPNSAQKNQFITPSPQFFNNPAEVPKIPGANENPKPPSPQIPGFSNFPQKLPSDPKEFQKNAPKVYSDLPKSNPQSGPPKFPSEFSKPSNPPIPSPFINMLGNSTSNNPGAEVLKFNPPGNSNEVPGTRQLGFKMPNLPSPHPNASNLPTPPTPIPLNQPISIPIDSGSKQIIDPISREQKYKYDPNLLEIINAFSNYITNNKINDRNITETIEIAVKKDPEIGKIRSIEKILALRNPKGIRPKKFQCSSCKAEKETDNFTSISCGEQECKVCSQCRVDQRDNLCPLCHREYSTYEIELLKILKASLIFDLN